MTKPTVTLCMIVCNEEEWLAASLLSAKPYVDETIVVDTGSTDRTALIAERHGATVRTFRWNDHFAEARNDAMKRARGDWILVLDADERLMQVDIALWDRLLGDDGAAGYYVAVRHYHSARADDYETDAICRLFRNLPGLAYRGRIHEDITTCLADRYPRLTVAHSGLTVLHYGHMRGAEVSERKAARNRKLLERAVREESDRVYYRYALGAETFLQERFREAADELAPLLPVVPPAAGYAADLAYKAAYALWRSERRPQALQAAETGLVREPDHAELQELHAVLLLEEGRPEEALHRLKRYDATAVAADARREHRRDYWLGLSHRSLGNWREAARCLERCVGEGEMSEQALLRWLDLAFLVHSADELTAKLERIASGPNGGHTLGHICRYAIKWGAGDRVAPLLAGARAGLTEEERAFYRAVYAAQAGDAERGEAILAELVRSGAGRHAALYQWALHNRDADRFVRLDALFDYGKNDTGIAALANMLLRGREAEEAADEALVGQAAYAMLAMRAWSGFLFVWQNGLCGGEKLGKTIPHAWLPAVLRAPDPVRATVALRLKENGSFGERLLAGTLAAANGDKAADRRLFDSLIADYPQRLEPRIGLYAVLNRSSEWLPYLLSACS